MKFALKQLITLLDLTSLNDSDSAESTQRLCQKAKTPFGSVAAVCLYPRFVAQAKTQLKNTDIAVATVANFPTGDESSEAVNTSIKQSIRDGADEIDVVFPYRAFLAGHTTKVLDFLTMCRTLCDANARLKIILETGELGSAENISAATELSIESGADFIKTSTGKTAVGATPEAAHAILNAIKQHPERDIGFKVSGGVRAITDAILYVTLGVEMMGERYVQAKTFRIGASQLLGNILAELEQQG